MASRKIRGNAYTVEIKGLRELLYATDRLGGDIKKNTRRALREAAEPVRREAAARFSKYDTKSAASYGISVRRTGSVAVEQRLRRTTGRRPDYGRLQMSEALLPALHNNTETTTRLLSEALDRAAREWGQR